MYYSIIIMATLCRIGERSVNARINGHLGRIRISWNLVDYLLPFPLEPYNVARHQVMTAADIIMELSPEVWGFLFSETFLK
jgi:hypothetical protein